MSIISKKEINAIVDALQRSDSFFSLRDQMNAIVHCENIKFSSIRDKISYARTIALTIQERIKNEELIKKKRNNKKC